MTNMDNFQTASPSFESRLIQFFMGVFGMKKAMEKKIRNNTYSKKPASIPRSIYRKYKVEIEEFKGRKVWTISPKINESNTTILFLHGGAYYANITQMHWQFVEQLLVSTNATIIVPDYPLAPESKCIETYQFINAVYANLISCHPTKHIVFMGDSAGGGLALGFAQKISNEGIKQPEKIVLFSPWLDVSMANPEIVKYDKLDNILNVTGLKIAGKSYAGDLNVKDFRVSPIYGDFSNLGKISIFIGTNDVLLADARKFKQLLDKQQIYLDYFEYPGMFHDWVVVSNLRETKEVIKWVASLLNHTNS
jgi:acetyl esterase/lipase